ncbi:MAG: FxsA family protein [Granulosicoccus sp.]
MPYALILFIAMPIIEIAVLLRIGSALGWLPTLAIVILTAILGTTMLRHQGLATLNLAKQRMNAGEMPAQQMLEGVILMIGGVLLLTPGFVTDAFGFACLFPYSRRWLAARIAARSVIGFGGVSPMGSGTGTVDDINVGPRAHPPNKHRKTAGDVIDGDYQRIDE